MNAAIVASKTCSAWRCAEAKSTAHVIWMAGAMAWLLREVNWMIIPVLDFIHRYASL